MGRDALRLAEGADQLVGGERRHEVDARRSHGGSRLLVEEVAVLDTPHPGAHGVENPLRRVDVRHGDLLDRACLVAGRGHLLDGELRVLELVGRRDAPAAGHDLDRVCPGAEHLARRAAHLVGRVAATRRGDEAGDALDRRVLLVRLAPVAVAARLREARPGEEHARGAEQAARDRLREPPVEAERVPHGGEARVERLLENVLDAERQRRGRLPPRLRGVDLDDRSVHVRIGEPGHQRPATAVDACRVAGQVGLRRAGHPHDALSLDDDGRSRRRVGAAAIEERAVLEDSGARRGPRYAGSSVA